MQLLLTIVIFMLFQGCASKKSECKYTPEDICVTGDLEKFEFSDYFELSAVVPLETNKNCYIKDIRKIYVNNLGIFIQDGYEYILVFSREGRYQRRIQHFGQGPGEWSEISDFDVNHKDSTLILRSQYKEMVYSIDDRLISEKKVDISSSVFYRIDSKANAFYDYNIPNQQNTMNGVTYNLVIQKGNKTPDLYCKAIKCMAGVNSSRRYARSFCQTQENMYLVESYNDTIYSISKNAKVVPSYRIDFGSKRFPVEKLLNQQLFQEFEHSYAHFISAIYENNDLFYFEYSDCDVPARIIYEKGSKKSYRGNSLFDKINNLPTTGFINYYGNVDKVLSLVEPSDYLKFLKIVNGDKKTKVLPELKNVKEEDNTILVFYTLKTKSKKDEK